MNEQKIGVTKTENSSLTESIFWSAANCKQQSVINEDVDFWILSETVHEQFYKSLILDYKMNDQDMKALLNKVLD